MSKDPFGIEREPQTPKPRYWYGMPTDLRAARQREDELERQVASQAAEIRRLRSSGCPADNCTEYY